MLLRTRWWRVLRLMSVMTSARTVPPRSIIPSTSWTSTATWNNADVYQGTNTPWTMPGGDFDATAAATATVGGSIGAYKYWYPTQLVQDWADGAQANNGLVVKQEAETTTNVLQFVSSMGSPSQMPFLKVMYEYGIGTWRRYTLDGGALNDRMSYSVNPATGNLVLQAHDLSLNGTGLDLNIDRYYNSLASGFEQLGGAAMGPDWVLGTGMDVYLQVFADGSVVYHAPGGHAVLFLWDGTKYTPPDGIDGDLVKNANSTYTLTFRGDGSKQNFDVNGNLTSEVDANGNTITVTTVSGGPCCGTGYHTTQITDTKGHVTSFTYNGSGYLTQVTDPSNRLYKYAYDASGRVTSIIRVTGGGTGPTTTITYNDSASPPNTVITDPNGHNTTYYYDTMGRVTRTTDALGRSSSVTYTANDDVATSTNTAGGVTTNSYSTDDRNNLLQTEGPVNADGYRQTTRYVYSNGTYLFYPTSYKDAQNHSWSYSYGTNGNLLAKAEGDAPGQNPVTFDYNADGTAKTITDAKNTGNSACSPTTVTICFSYDPTTHNLTRTTYPSPLGAFSFTYDSLSRIASVTDGKSQ